MLVKQKRLNRTAPVPCIVRTDGLAEEDSLAENVQRAPLHPLDQFRAFQAMREKGKSEEEIAAAFFVSAGVVKQRLKLAAVAPNLLDAYADEEMTLDQLMAFTVNPDHKRQDQVWGAIKRGYTKQPYEIRRMLTEGAVRASDRRAQFVGLDAYEAAGGVSLRDLFQSDDGGWLQDAGLLAKLVDEKLEAEAQAIRAEGWKWIEIGTDFPYGHTYGLRRIIGETEPMSEDEIASFHALKAEYDKFEEEYADAEEFPEEIDIRLGEIETAMEALQERPVRFEPDEIAIAGVFVSIGHDGRLRVERGYIRPEDEPSVESDVQDEVDGVDASAEAAVNDVTNPDASEEAEEEDDFLKPLSDRLVMELTAHRTLALRDALANDPQTAFLAALHAMTLRLFYHYPLDSCVEIAPHSAGFGAQAPGLGDTAYALSVDARTESWLTALPKAPEDLWDALVGFDGDSREALFAHCVAMTVNAVYEPYNRRPRALAHADVLATTLGLDMAAAGWTPTGESYLSRVTKARILEAVREAKDDEAADRIASLKKPDMVAAAEELLAGTGWLPEALHTPDSSESEAQSAEHGGETAMGDSAVITDDEPVTGAAFATAAE